MSGQTIIGFETRPLANCVELTKRMDRQCFPEEMWLDELDLQLLIDHNAEATILKLNGCEIGQAITLSEIAAKHILRDADTAFQVHTLGAYSYSEAILPSHQNLGYGGLLLHEIALRMRQRGYTSISAHVRTRYGWNIKRTQTLQVERTRILHDFWEDPRELVQYQNAHI